MVGGGGAGAQGGGGACSESGEGFGGGNNSCTETMAGGGAGYGGIGGDGGNNPNTGGKVYGNATDFSFYMGSGGGGGRLKIFYNVLVNSSSHIYKKGGHGGCARLQLMTMKLKHQQRIQQL